ncbi:hypothetical protein [Streptomyces sp. CA2R101]|uniref:hypothetical protein n=1 Tax=Streptomyces sp. CA2R101 TaxID=3120152 RepID=UPI0030096C8D
MEAGRETPAPTRRTRKQKKIRLQVGDDLDVTIGFYVSPRALALIGTAISAVGGYGGYLIQR